MASFAKILSRIKHSRWTKAYVALGLVQIIVICVLQSIILAHIQLEENLMEVDTFEAIDRYLEGDSPDIDDGLMFLIDGYGRFERMKWENIAFIAFQVWLFSMIIDATVHQNAAEVITLAVVNAFCPIISGLEVMDARLWLKKLEDSPFVSYNSSYLLIALYLEIALTVCATILSLLFLYVSYQVIKDIGWVIYKKIGPNLQIQGMYRTFQFFVLALKIGVFVQFFVPVFYFVQLVLITTEFEEYLPWDAYVCLVVTILMLPSLFFARFAVAAERLWRIIAFIIFQLLAIVNMCYMLYQTSESEWYTWIVVVSVSIAVVVSTIVLTACCAHNFDKGLKPHVQRGRAAKKETNTEPSETDALDDHHSERSWNIDD